MLKPYVNVLTHGHHTMNVISQRCIVADRRKKDTHSIVYVNSAFKILYRNTHTHLQLGLHTSFLRPLSSGLVLIYRFTHPQKQRRIREANYRVL